MAQAAENQTGNAVTVIDQFKGELESRTEQIQSLLPPTVSVQKFKTAVIQAIGAKPDLMQCDRTSLMKSCMEAAEVGLSLNPVMRHADILPVWDGRLKKKVAQFRPRYMGLMSLARASGEVIDIYARVVRASDVFEYEYGTEQRIVHRPVRTDRGDLVAAYCVWKTRDGVTNFEVMEAEDIIKIKVRSPSKDKNGSLKGPWITDEEEMWRKTVVRRASKYMDISAESFVKAVALDDAAEGGRIIDHEPARPAGLIPPRPTRTDTEVHDTEAETVEPEPEYEPTEAEREAAVAAERAMDAEYNAAMGGTVTDAEEPPTEPAPKPKGGKVVKLHWPDGKVTDCASMTEYRDAFKAAIRVNKRVWADTRNQETLQKLVDADPKFQAMVDEIEAVLAEDYPEPN